MGGQAQVRAESDVGDFDEHVAPFLRTHCHGCHGETKQEGDLDLRSLDRDLVGGGDQEAWDEVIERLAAGEMPPKRAKRPSEPERKRVVDRLRRWMRDAEDAASVKARRLGIRRMNRLEYRNTLRDLIGHPFDPTELFSPDTVSNGFDNVGSALAVSPLHVERFVAATERLLDKVIEIPEKPPLRQHWRILNSSPARKPLLKDNGSWHDGHRGKKKDKIKPGFLEGNVQANIEIPNGATPYTMVDLTEDPPKAWEGAWDIRAFGGSQIDEGVEIKNGDNAFGFKWFAYEEGIYRVRVHVSSFGPESWTGASPKLGIALFPEGTLWQERLLTLGTSEVVELELYRDDVDWYVKTSGNRAWGVNLFYQLTQERDADGKHVPFGVHISEIEVEGPIHREWPPLWHRRVFPAREKDEADDAYAERVLQEFLPRAYRRPVRPQELSRLLEIYRGERAKGRSLKRALRMPLATILTSPSFLYLDPDGDSDDETRSWRLASSLSYFLWRSLPDARLFELARSGDLLRRDVLLAEVDRMLENPKSGTFVERFTRQWLGLDKLEDLDVDAALYPEFDLLLRESMLGESTQFFREILRSDLSVYQLLDSDFLMLNEPIARHYGIDGIVGGAFRKVPRRDGDRRGGVLTQAAVLTATSNGQRTLPIKRGAFVLDRLLADPPKPPPPDVPSVDDATTVDRGSTLRQRLEKHRDDPSCRGCHRKIDPLGFALESYDAIGRWRDRELVETDAAKHRPVPFTPGETISIRFENGLGEPNDWVAILPADEKDNRKFEQLDMWVHTTGTRKRLPNGVFSGTLELVAPKEPGDYEARLFFAGGYETVAAQRFSVAKPDGDRSTTEPKAPLALDPLTPSRVLTWAAVDSAGELSDGRPFANVDEFKARLLEDKDAFLEGLTEKMLIYALGRPLEFGDRRLVREAVSELQRRPTLKTLLRGIVTSETFFQRGPKR